MRVAVYPADQGGCGCYRLIWPSQALISFGYDVKLVLPDADKDEQLQARWQEDILTGERYVSEVVKPDADVVVFQRPLWHHQVEGILSLQKQGIKVVVEIDDDFSCIPPDNPAYGQTLPKMSPARNRDHLAAACELADLVTVTTPALARRYGSHGRVAIIPNHVPLRYTELDVVKDDTGTQWVGWSGSIVTHYSDLEATRGAMQTVLNKTGAKFAVIGTGKGIQAKLRLRENPPASGWLHIERMPEAMGMIDVGIVPLRINQFNEAKSWLKGLEFLSLGVPVVVSPTAEYRRLHMAFGDAVVLADRVREWEHGTISQLESGHLRGLEARLKVQQNWTIEGQCGKWWDAWASVLKN
jgi:glycosyltransferase involved in cell wall biosynthesis